MKKLILFLYVAFWLIPSSFSQIIYQHDFGTTSISTHPYTVAPEVFHPNLQNSSWTNNKNTWTSFAGSTGQAIGLSNSSGSPEITLQLEVQAGYQLSITAFSFWRQRSNNGAQNWTMAINGIPVGSGSVPIAGVNTGVTPVSNSVNNLTGIIQVVLSLSGGTAGTGTFRLDDFALHGTVSSTCTPPSIQASSLNFSNASPAQMDLSFIRGNGNGGVIVIAKAGSPVSSDPQWNIVYTADLDFSGNGSPLGGGKVVYNSNIPAAGQPVNFTVTGLSPGTTYHFHIYEYHGGPCYLVPALTASNSTVNVPALNTPVAINRLMNQADLGATVISDGGSSIVERGTVYSTTPGVTATDNPLPDGGVAVNAFIHTRTGLNPETQYFFRGYARNAAGSSLSPESNFYTLSNPPLEEASDLVLTPVSPTQLDLNWNAASFPLSGATASGYVILRRMDNTDPDITGILNGAAVSAFPAPGTQLIATILSGSTTQFSNISLNSTTQYNYLVIPFTWDGIHPQTFHYFTSNAPSGNGLTLGSGATDYFRSVKDGNWNNAGTWQSSSNNVNWIAATSIPTSSAKSISINSPHTITITAPASANALVVNAGATLVHRNGYSFNVIDGNGADASGVDFIVNGIYELYGEAPTFVAGAVAEIRNGGLVKVNANVNGKSDDFARYPEVVFKTGSVMQWNTSNPFQTKDVVYFSSASAADKAVFRISTTLPGALGSVSPTVFKGKFEVAAPYSFTFDARGAKTFRDGLGGGGTLVHKGGTNASGACGGFIIDGAGAVIDGSLVLHLENNTTPGINELEIRAGGDVSLGGSAVVNVGSDVHTGGDLLINGNLKISAGAAVNLAHGSLILNGKVDESGSGFFIAGNSPASATHITIGGTAGGNAGILKFKPGYHYVNRFFMNRLGNNSRVIMGSDMVANTFLLSNGILVTGENLVTWNNNGPVNTGNKNSFIATCVVNGSDDQEGTPLMPSIPYDGLKGLRINKVNNNDPVYFPIGPNMKSFNRVFIQNASPELTGITAIVGMGDVGNTPAPRVNRIWYLKETNPGYARASMRLYFTKENWSLKPFPGAQNEVEDGFNYGDIHLVQKTYEGSFINNSNTGTADVMNFIGAADETEIYGQYTIGVSRDLHGNDNGIEGFTRFTVINENGFVLPINHLQLQVFSTGVFHRLEWTNNNESNLDYYEIETSADGNHFTSLGIYPAKKNHGVCHYSWLHQKTTDPHHFYRIKMVSLNHTLSYSAIVKITANRNLKGEWTVYPNPVTYRNFILQINDLPPARYSLLLYNSAGQLQLSQPVFHTESSSSRCINLPLSVSAGTYVLVLKSKTTFFRKTLLVQ